MRTSAARRQRPKPLPPPPPQPPRPAPQRTTRGPCSSPVLFLTLPLVCPRCGADMRIIVFITETAPVRQILTHIAEPPRISPARGSPAWNGPPVDPVPNWEALAQPSPEYVLDQEVQW